MSLNRITTHTFSATKTNYAPRPHFYGRELRPVTKYQKNKKKAGPRPTNNDGEKMTVKRKLLLTLPNDYGKAFKKEDGQKEETSKS